MLLHPSRSTIEGNLMEGGAVSATVLYMSMSLDGFIAGPNERPDNGLGDGGERLHEWPFPAAGGMISTADDMLLYGRALGTGKGLLPPKQQAERLDSFILNVNGDAGCGLGLTYDRGWIGHGGDIPGYNTQLFYHPRLDATVVVEVNSDVAAGGNCPEGIPTLKDGPKDVPCDLPAPRIFRALAEALGKPATPIPGLESP